MSEFNDIQIRRWFNDNGDYTHNINYDLTDKSIVIDLGGYTGVWVKQIVDKYNPFVYVLEPVGNFYNVLNEKFRNNDKVITINSGISKDNKSGVLFLDNDGTSSLCEHGESVNVNFINMQKLFDDNGISNVDLLQINIEGDEYDLLDDLIENGIIVKFDNIQIQFHNNIKEHVFRRDKIQKGLISNGFKNKFNYPFVWESWTKIK